MEMAAFYRPPPPAGVGVGGVGAADAVKCACRRYRSVAATMTSLLKNLALILPARPAVAACYRSAWARSFSSSRGPINAGASAAGQSNVSFSGSGFLFPFHLGVGQQLLHARVSGSDRPSPQNQISSPIASTRSRRSPAPLSPLGGFRVLLPFFPNLSLLLPPPRLP